MKLFRLIKTTLLTIAVATVTMPAQAQTIVLTEDFSNNTNIFGITSTEMAVSKAAIYDTKLTGFGPVLAVCNTSVDGVISGANGQSIPVDGTVTVEWDAFHGYFSNSRNSTVTLLNSDGMALASYIYNSQSCKVTSTAIGGQDVAGFEAFNLQNANGFGGNGKPYTATGNPHIAITITARGGISMAFSKNGTVVKTVLGSIGSLKKDVAKIRVESKVDNTDRCYAIDNIKVTTGLLEEDPNYVEPIVNTFISGADRMTFGPSTAESFRNPYTVVIIGADGTTITEESISEKVHDFRVVWDIEGFKTINDTEGQYCDSYGAFSVNGEGKVNTTFNLRDVPMNFFGRMTATITYNGTTTVAEKYVIAQGDPTMPTNQILPLGGYPSNLSVYPDALKGYKVTGETYGNANDLILGGWCVAGSDVHNALLLGDADGTKYVRLTASAAKKSHVLTQTIESPTGQLIFRNKLRFNNAGAVVTLTGGYPFWSSSRYTCPVTLNYTGTTMTLNGKTLKNGENDVQFTTGTWYQVVLSADKSSECCFAQVYSDNGQLLATSGVLPWAEASSPTYFSIGMDNNSTGTVDMAFYEVYKPQPTNFSLTADKTTLSIPNKESALLIASATDINGYEVTGQASWSVIEEDMQQSITITPDATDSHKAVITLTESAGAGTATIQVGIGGITKTIALSLTSSSESIKFTESATSITIPMDDGDTTTANFKAIVIDGEGNDLHNTVTLALYDRDNTQTLTNTPGISFDAQTGVLTVTAEAVPTLVTIRATGKNSQGDDLMKGVRVNIHGMKFDFGYADNDAVADGFTLVGPQTAYNVVNGYGLKNTTPSAGGNASGTDATADYLEGVLEFDFKVQKGVFYSIDITYQGTLTTGYINNDLAGYTLGTHSTLTTETYTLPATFDVADLRLAPSDATSVARLAQVTVTKQPQRQKRSKRVVHHIGDSTSANNGSWAYRLSKTLADYKELSELCDFHNDGAGGRNLSTYYTQGRLANVLRDIYPDDVVMFGNNGTNGMGSSFEADMNYYLNAAEMLGAKVIINSYTPHGAVSNYASGYDAQKHTFDSYRRDSYETIVRRVAEQRTKNDDNYLGFVEIGKNADAIFNAYVADYAGNGYSSADAAAQAIIQCFADHNHYSNSPLACQLMLNGYNTIPGIVEQLVRLLSEKNPSGISLPEGHTRQSKKAEVYNLNGQRLDANDLPSLRGVFIVGGKKLLLK